jgi:tellurite resistance protein
MTAITLDLNSTAATFTADEWKSLLNSPFIIFLAVAVSDGKLDKKEADRFMQILRDAGKYKCPVLNKVLIDALPHFSNFINDLISGKINPLKELTSVSEITENKLPVADANRFKLSLLAIAKEIAESSGGFLGFGSKISKEEMQVINGIATTLKLAI